MSSLCKYSFITINKNDSSPTPTLRKTLNPCNDLLPVKFLQTANFIKRISLLILPRTPVKASMTVETALVLPLFCSEENLQRIEKHREQRKDLQFTTLECPYQVGAAAVERDGVVLLEDVSNLLANAMFERGGDEASVYADIEALCSRCRLLVAVTITGLRADGYDGETAAYIRALNGLNQKLYDRAAAAVAMKDGAPFAEKGDLDEII